MQNPKIAIIGSGTIGLSFAALHLSCREDAQVTIYDPRSDLPAYVEQTLPKFLTSAQLEAARPRLHLSSSLEEAVQNADIVQEQGPENLEFKASIWPAVERACPAGALLWSSTSGIPASAQGKDMVAPERLVVVHPYNPPHVMPLLEVVPSPTTADEVVQRTVAYWQAVGRAPVVIRKECKGFVANRLAFALLREAIHLVAEGVVSVEDLDTIVQSSMGPRWTVAGPFKSYHAGGGVGGLRAFFENIGGTVQQCWEDAGQVHVGDGWEENVFQQTQKAYGSVDTAERDRITRAVLDAVAREKRTS